MERPFRTAVRVGATSVLDESAARVLETVRERAEADTVVVTAATWSRESGGRTTRADVGHGVPGPDPEWVGGAYAAVRPEYYRRTVLGPVPRARDAGERDVLAETLAAARERDVAVYALVDESAAAPELRRRPGFPGCLEVDMWNKPARRPCYANPDYREWHLGFVEDVLTGYEIDGLTWRAERFGPLTLLAQQPTPQGLGLVSCFCRWCLARADERGVDWRRAQTGFRRLVLLNAAVSSGERPVEGVFSSYWRLLLGFPEILAWQSLWTDGQVQLYRDVFGLARAIRPEIEVGWDLDPMATVSPFVRASLDFSELSHICDSLTLGTYDASGGEALGRLARDMSRALFGDLDEGAAYGLLQAMLGVEEASLDEVAEAGLSAEYVRREVARGVTTNEGRCLVYAGIDVGAPALREPSPDGTRGLADADGGPVRSTPERVAAAVGAAHAGGASGIVLGRKYADMRLDELDAVGAAVRALRAA